MWTLFTFNDPVSEVLNDRSATAQWGEVMDLPDKQHLLGKFRDLYPENVVGDAHLRELRRLGLLADRTSGIDVEPLSPHLYWMTVSQEALERMRGRLVQNGLILAGISGVSGPYHA